MTSQLTTRRPFTPQSGPTGRKPASAMNESGAATLDTPSPTPTPTTLTTPARGNAVPTVARERSEPTSRESFYEGMIFGAGGAIIAGVIMFILALAAGG